MEVWRSRRIRRVDHTALEVGGECWFAENLASSIYRNGESIDRPYKLKDWDVGIGYYHDSGAGLGFLYNSTAIYDERRLCPTGWRLPLFKDWENLLEAYGFEMSSGRFEVEEDWVFANQFWILH